MIKPRAHSLPKAVIHTGGIWRVGNTLQRDISDSGWISIKPVQGRPDPPLKDEGVSLSRQMNDQDD